MPLPLHSLHCLPDPAPALPCHRLPARLQARVLLDPYAKVIVNSRRHWGQMGPVSQPALLCPVALPNAAPAALAACTNIISSKQQRRQQSLPAAPAAACLF
jgi:hypothetical protein